MADPDPEKIAAISAKYYDPRREVELEHQRKVCLINHFARNSPSALRWYKRKFQQLITLLAEEPQTAKRFFDVSDLPLDILDNIRTAARLELRRIRAESKTGNKATEG